MELEEETNKEIIDVEKNCKKEKLKQMSFEEIKNIRNKFMIILDEDKLNNEQKSKFLEIIMSLNKATSLQKERFILYYGLDIKQEKIHNFSKIAELQKCTYTAIRSSVRLIRSKLLMLSPKELKILLQILEELE